MKKISIIIFAFVLFFTVNDVLFAAIDQNIKSPGFQLLPCDGVKINNQGVDCDYNAAINGFNGLVKALIYLSIPFATVMFMYAGFLYMTAGDKPGNKQKAKKIFTSILIGLVLVLGAWLIVYTFIDKLSTDSELFNQNGGINNVTKLK